jgi:hypothetical protein
MNEHFANVLFFLLWAERQDSNMWFGGIRIAEAIDSLAAIMNVNPEQLRELI